MSEYERMEMEFDEMDLNTYEDNAQGVVRGLRSGQIAVAFDELTDATAALIDAVTLAPMSTASRRQQSLDRERLALESALARNAIARDVLARKEELRTKLGSDNLEDGDVLRWTKRFAGEGSKVFTYVAVKGGNRWYHTAYREGRHELSWDALVGLMVDKGELLSVALMEVIPGRRLVG